MKVKAWLAMFEKDGRPFLPMCRTEDGELVPFICLELSRLPSMITALEQGGNNSGCTIHLYEMESIQEIKSFKPDNQKDKNNDNEHPDVSKN